MTQEEHLQKVMQLFAKSAELEVKAYKLGQEYTDNYSPFKALDRVVIKPEFGRKECGIIQRVKFDKFSDIEGMALLVVEPYTRNWNRIKNKRRKLYIKDKTEIIEHIKSV